MLRQASGRSVGSDVGSTTVVVQEGYGGGVVASTDTNKLTTSSLAAPVITFSSTPKALHQPLLPFHYGHHNHNSHGQGRPTASTQRQNLEISGRSKYRPRRTLQLLLWLLRWPLQANNLRQYGSILLTVLSSVSIVVCNKYLLSNLGFPCGAIVCAESFVG